MIDAICLTNIGSALPDTWFSIGWTQKSKLDITIGRSYQIYAMALWRGHLVLLLCDDGGLPNWYPIDAFNVMSCQLPASWKFSYVQKPGSLLQAVWGYGRLIDDPEHYDALLERDADAVNVFRGVAAGKV